MMTSGCTHRPAAPETVRFATYNVALNFPQRDGIVHALSNPEHEHARRVAAVIQHQRPDVLLLNELDHDPQMRGLALFHDRFLAQAQYGQSPIEYPFRYVAPVNTGVATGVDLNGDGNVDGPEDAHGYGVFPGQYGMVVLSRFPIDIERVRTFQQFRWRDLPQPWWPRDPETGEHYYSAAARDVLRLSSKSHWDVPIKLPDGSDVHFLVSHPTPPVFDGPEDRNGRRNHNEIRFWADYIAGADYPADDQGRAGGLPPGSRFIIGGDLNADPRDGDSSGNAIAQLLEHPAINAAVVPTSQGAVLAAAEGVNRHHGGDPAADTGDFSEDGPGNMRIDYLLPSRNLQPVDAGVFWPPPGEIGVDWIHASDHRLVWLDIALAR